MNPLTNAPEEKEVQVRRSVQIAYVIAAVFAVMALFAVVARPIHYERTLALGLIVAVAAAAFGYSGTDAGNPLQIPAAAGTEPV
jgi:hypothetical protein